MRAEQSARVFRMTLLNLENLRKSYGALVVTDDLTLTVARGDLVGILGPNGAGKTTLFI
jgi:branched-chain amino acid transport system ATP-binding protein